MNEKVTSFEGKINKIINLGSGENCYDRLWLIVHTAAAVRTTLQHLFYINFFRAQTFLPLITQSLHVLFANRWNTHAKSTGTDKLVPILIAQILQNDIRRQEERKEPE